MASRKAVEGEVKSILANRGNQEVLRLVRDVLLLQMAGDEESAAKHFGTIIESAMKGEGALRIADVDGRTMLRTKEAEPATLTAGPIVDPLVQEIMELLIDILDDEPDRRLSTLQARVRVVARYFNVLHPGTRTDAKSDAVKASYFRILGWAADEDPRVPFRICKFEYEDHVCLP